MHITICGKSLLNLPNPDDFRETLKSLLSRNSDNLSTFCCHCGQSKNKTTKCQSCKYRVCTDCTKYYNENFTVCQICSQNILK